VCTVTILPRTTLAGYGTSLDRPVLRIVCNRDEQRTRAAALPPTVHTIGDRRVAMPIDPAGGGSWIAVSDRGLVFALLNLSQEGGVDAPSRATTRSQPMRLSRGMLIPEVAASDSVTQALDHALSVDVTRYHPFRLLLVDRHQLVECWPEARRLRYRRSFLQGPLMRTSSGLGDSVVLGPRRALFRRFFDFTRDPRAAQDGFHEHQWSGREHVSVRMERPDAKTVSRTVVDVRCDVASLTYDALDGAPPARVSIPIAVDAGRAVMCS
jgi:hypothetical protein